MKAPPGLILLACWSLLGSSSVTMAQEKGAAPAAEAPQAEGEKPREDRKLALLRLRIEVWEIAALDAARWLDEAKGSAGLAELRSGFLFGQKPARLIASPTLSIEEGDRRFSDSTCEWIYPVEWAGSELPDAPKPPPGFAEEAFVRGWRDSVIGKFLCPDTLEVRDLGDSLQAEVRRIPRTPGAWDLSLSFDRVDTPGDLEFGGGSLIKEPLFTTFNSRASGIRLKEGCWRLLSVMEPPPGLDGKPADSRWLTLVRIDPEP